MKVAQTQPQVVVALQKFTSGSVNKHSGKLGNDTVTLVNLYIDL